MSHKPAVSRVSHDLIAGDSDDEDGSTLPYDPNDSHQINPTRFKIYAVLDAIKFLIIGGVIFYINYMHNKTLYDKRSIYCCDCYYIAKEPDLYGINSKYRIDWSFCTPDCTNCTYCDVAFNHSALLSFNYSNNYKSFQSNQCPIKDYKPPSSLFFRALNEKYSGHCPSNLSFNTMELFNKSYYTYAVGAIVVVLLYGILIFSFINCCNILSGVNLLLYNVIISEVLFYLMFKPYQYYRKEIKYPYNSSLSTICQIDAMNETMETVLTIFIYCCLGFIVIEWILCLCRCCWNKWRYKFRGYYWRMERYLIIFICIVCLLFFGVLIYSSIIMILERLKDESNKKEMRDEIIIICCLDISLLFSCIDIFLCKFCRKKAKRIWNAKKLASDYNFYEKFGRSESNLSNPTHHNRNNIKSNVGTAIVEERADDDDGINNNLDEQQEPESSLPSDYKYQYFPSTEQEFKQEIK